jgi:hypothetical protein
MSLEKLSGSGILVALLAAFAAGCNGDTPPERIPLPEAEQSAGDAHPAGSESAPTGAIPVSLEKVVVRVYKSPTCGCCSAWVEHMEEAGFQVETHDMGTAELAALKLEQGVKAPHQSCHTAVVGDYVVEGHVPADLVKRVLQERPEIAGLAVPGMPRGSPGMEVPGGANDRYDVIAFGEDGRQAVYASR